jgi:SAM-dependent methyltransferase
MEIPFAVILQDLSPASSVRFCNGRTKHWKRLPISAAERGIVERPSIMLQTVIPQSIAQVEAESIHAPMTVLKHPRLMELLCAPDWTGETPLRIARNELTGAAWKVPITGGIPDFVAFAPKTRRILEIEIPIDAEPASAILAPPPNPDSVPSWFEQARFKFPFLQSHEKGFLLDVGAGQGNRQTFENLGYDYVSLDISFNSGQTHQGEADVDVVADCHRMPIKSSTLEVVDCTAVIEHLYCPPLAVQEIYRILKPGGLLVGCCSFLEGQHFESQTHYTHLGLFRLLKLSGLNVVHLFPGQSIWESHAGSIYFGLPASKGLGRLHRWLYLSLVKLLGSESPDRRLLSNAAVFHFAAVKPLA